jgi:hypothetical protein
MCLWEIKVLGCIACIVGEDGKMRDFIGRDIQPTGLYARMTKHLGSVYET